MAISNKEKNNTYFSSLLKKNQIGLSSINKYKEIDKKEHSKANKNKKGYEKEGFSMKNEYSEFQEKNCNALIKS